MSSLDPSPDGNQPVGPDPHRASQASRGEPSNEQRLLLDAHRFRTLCESAPLGIFECDPEGKLIYRNRQVGEILGLGPQDEIETEWLARIHPEDYDELMAKWDLTLRQVSPLRHDYRLVLPSGETRWLRVHVMPTRQDKPSFMAMLEDITDRRRTQEAVRVSEERFRQIAENIDEIFWVSNADLTDVLYVSPPSMKVWGHAPQEFYDRPSLFLEGIHPHDRQMVLDIIPALREEPYDGVFRIIRPDGSVRTIRVRAFPVRNERGECYRLAGVTQDITRAKQVEEELLAEQRFLQHLLQLQEGERKLIAYDIHDGFLQSVIAALMHLEGLGAGVDVSAAAKARLEVPVTLLREAIVEARRMISGLRPPILDEQGLVAAIEYLVSEHADQDVNIRFEHDVRPDRFEPVLEGTLFRIVQEALTNVLRHSHAKEAVVRLSRAGERLLLSVEDWGVGFDPNQTSSRQFGLRGIRERARLFGGKAIIHSEPGSGTRISVELPLNAKLQTLSPAADPLRDGAAQS
jgi:PAS domain S-box-containing protein